MGICEVQKSGIHGEGVFAAKNIAADVTLFETRVMGPAGVWVNISPNCQYNHSKKNTNCRSETRGRFKFLMTIRKIEKGEELLVDFTKDPDLEQPQEGWSE